MKDRVLRLITVRENLCTLRKQNQEITMWFKARMNEYNDICDNHNVEDPAVRLVLDKMYTLLKFMILPNNESRKFEILAAEWPSLEGEVKKYL